MFVVEVQDKARGRFERIGAQQTREAARAMGMRAAPFHQMRVFQVDARGAVMLGTTETWKG